MGRQRLPDDLTARRAGIVIGAITLAASLAAGILMRSVDHDDFPSIGSGLWWATPPAEVEQARLARSELRRETERRPFG
jgi:hypothetical protein